MLTDLTDDNANKYRTWVGEFADYLLFLNAEYSYNELQNCSEQIVQELITDTIYGLTNIKVTYGSCQPGDSGGPFFRRHHPVLTIAE